MANLSSIELLLPNPSECDERIFLAAAIKNAREHWKRMNPAKVRRPGHPSLKNVVWAACKRVRSAHPKTGETTLGRWVQLIAEDLSGRGKRPCRDTIHAHCRNWMISTLPVEGLPPGIGAYLLTNSEGFREVRQILIWSRLVKEFSSVSVWMKNYREKYGVVPLSDLPEDVLPKDLLAQVESRYGRFKPPLVSQWISRALQHPSS